MIQFEEFSEKVKEYYNTCLPESAIDDEGEAEFDKTIKEINEKTASIRKALENPEMYDMWNRSRETIKMVNKIGLETAQVIGKLSSGNTNIDDNMDKITNIKDEFNLYESNLREEAIKHIEEEKTKEEKKRIEREERNLYLISKIDENVLKELYNTYLVDENACVNRLIDSFTYDWAPFRPTCFSRSSINYITKNEKLQSIIVEAIEESNNPKNEGRPEMLKKWDLTLEELVEITHLMIEPKFPLINCYHEDEYEKDTIQKFIIYSNHNLYISLQSSEAIVEDILRKKSSKIEIIFECNDVTNLYELDYSVLSKYPYFAGGTKNINIPNIEFIPYIIRALYTGQCNLSDKIFKDLNTLSEFSEICKNIGLDDIVNMCEIISE